MDFSPTYLVKGFPRLPHTGASEEQLQDFSFPTIILVPFLSFSPLRPSLLSLLQNHRVLSFAFPALQAYMQKYHDFLDHYIRILINLSL